MLNCSWPVCSFCRFSLVLIGLLCSCNTLPAQEPIVPPDAKLEKLFESKVLTEGVSVAPDGMVYFSEITFSHVSRDKNGAIDAGFIWRFDPATKETSIFRSPSGMSNGIKFGDTSPVQRGLFIRRRLLCEDIPPPPPDMMVSADEPPGGIDSKACKDQRYAEHREGGCAGCHALIDDHSK